MHRIILLDLVLMVSVTSYVFAPTSCATPISPPGAVYEEPLARLSLSYGDTTGQVQPLTLDISAVCREDVENGSISLQLQNDSLRTIYEVTLWRGRQRANEPIVLSHNLPILPMGRYGLTIWFTPFIGRDADSTGVCSVISAFGFEKCEFITNGVASPEYSSVSRELWVLESVMIQRQAERRGLFYMPADSFYHVAPDLTERLRRHNLPGFPEPVEQNDSCFADSNSNAGSP